VSEILIKVMIGLTSLKQETLLQHLKSEN